MKQKTPISLLYSIVIPVYNSGEWIEELLTQIEEVMNHVTDQYEIICVNDGSPKAGTWPALTKACRRITHLKAVNLQYNSGQFNALLCGMSYARGAYVITMDDDFQNDPKDLLTLINKMTASPCDCIIASYDRKQHGLLRKLGSRMVNYLSEKIYHKPKGIISNSFRIMNSDLAYSMTKYYGKTPQIGPLIFSLTKNIDTVEVAHRKRAYGKSGYTMRHLISETLNVVINGSTAPIDLVSICGLTVSGIAFLITIYYLILYLSGKIRVPGFTAIVLLISFFSGLILFSIGIVGKYIARIVNNTLGLPAYLVREIECGNAWKNTDDKETDENDE